MVITANPPKFDKRQPSRGAYDAIVYIEGSEVVAEDSNGRKIASGVAGTDDSAVIQSGISHIESIIGATPASRTSALMVLSGAFVSDAALIVNSDFAVLDMYGATISISADVDGIVLRNAKHCKVLGCHWKVPDNYSKSVYHLVSSAYGGSYPGGTTNDCLWNTIKDAEVYNDYNTALHDNMNWNVIELQVESDGRSVAENVFYNIWAQNCNRAVYFNNDAAGTGWMNSNMFSELYIYGYKIGIDFTDADLLTACSANLFTNCTLQSVSRTTHGIKNISGYYNSFNVYVWDWTQASSPGYVYEFGPNSRYCGVYTRFNIPSSQVSVDASAICPALSTGYAERGVNITILSGHDSITFAHTCPEAPSIDNKWHYTISHESAETIDAYVSYVGSSNATVTVPANVTGDRKMRIVFTKGYV